MKFIKIIRYNKNLRIVWKDQNTLVYLGMKNLYQYDELDLQQLKTVLKLTAGKRINLENVLYSINTERKIQDIYIPLVTGFQPQQLTIDEADRFPVKDTVPGESGNRGHKRG